MGSETIPEEPKTAPKTLLGPFGPILAYFLGGGQARNFPYPKKAKNFFPKFFLFALFRLPKGPGPSKPQNWPCRPPTGPHFGPICGLLGQLRVKKRVFLKNVILYKMTFLGSSDHFSLGSKWFWYLQNDRTHWEPQWGQKGSQKGQKWPAKPYLAQIGRASCRERVCLYV